MFGDGRARTISFFHFRSALSRSFGTRRVSLSADSNCTAGIIFNVAFGQYRLGAPVKQSLCANN